MANGADADGKGLLLSKIRVGSKRDFEFAWRTQAECGTLGRTRSQSNAGDGGSGVDGHAEQQQKQLKTYVSRKKRKGEEGVEKEVEALSEEEAKSDVVDMNLMGEDDVEKDGGDGFEEEAGFVNVVEGVSDEDENVVVDSVKEKRSGEGRGEEKGREDIGKLVIEFDTNNNYEFDRMLMEIEEDRRREEAVIGVQKDKFDESEAFLMDLEGDMLLKQGNECERRNGGCVMEDGKSEVENVVIDEDGKQGEKENEAEKVIGLGGEERRNDGGSGVVENVLVEGSLERKGLCEEGLKMGGGTEEEKKVNGVVETPTRRFTRSMLKSKVDIAVKNGGKGKAVEVVRDGGDNGVATALAKRTVRKYCKKLKDLFVMGILEGLTVKYMRAKGGSHGATGLQGVIKGLGILCSCDVCNGSKVVSPNVFEVHAGSSNKHPAENIYLENGKTLRNIMDVCRDSPLETLEEALQLAVGSSVRTNFCLNCRGPIIESGKGVPALLCNTCIELKESQVGSVGLTDTSDRSPESKSVRRSSQAQSTSKSSCSSKLQGQLTKKDLRKHKLVFEEGGLVDGTEVAYFSCGKKILEGYKSGWGIFCSCCESEVSPSQFEAHAGFASRRKPFHNIFMSNGVTLHELSIALSRERTIPSRENDDLCGMCMDGGNLLCCDTCPRAFHIECISLEAVPRGTWYCRYCDDSFYRKGRSVGRKGTVPGVDSVAKITNRCIRIVNKSSDTELGGCVLCRERDFSKNKFTRRTVMLCEQCEREYHVGCLKDKGIADLKELPQDKWHCCTECKRIYTALQKLIDRGEEKLPDAYLNVLKKKHEEGDSDTVANVDVRWRVLRGNSTAFSDGTRALLAKAIAIFHDRFDPILDTDKKRDLIPAMAYGRSKKGGQDYHGMYCAVLTVNNVVVSAGIFRIFGQEVAELPLVATRLDYGGQGYFQCLFSCFEKLVGFLHVKKLVLPSASETESIWTNKFGFNRMTDEEVDKCRNEYPLMVFEGTSMLHKTVPKCQILGSQMTEEK